MVYFDNNEISESNILLGSRLVKTLCYPWKLNMFGFVIFSLTNFAFFDKASHLVEIMKNAHFTGEILALTDDDQPGKLLQILC